MNGLTRVVAILLLMSVVGVAAADRRIAVLDDCDPADSTWDGIGGCLLEEGDVTRAEFGALLSSVLSTAVVGHPSWRNEPSFLAIEFGERVRVTNRGGRTHTFTEVAAFGGGKIPNPALNLGLVTAPECLASVDLAPGARLDIRGLALGNHRFMCCIHPWMRALIKVTPADD